MQALHNEAWDLHVAHKKAVSDAKKEAHVKKAMLLQTGQ